MRVFKLGGLAALAVVAGLSLTACQSDDGGDEAAGTGKGSASSQTAGDSGSSGDSEVTASAGASVSGASGGPSSEGDGKGGAQGADGGVAACRTDGLKVTAANTTIDGDDRATVAVTLKNAGGTSCALGGAYAGVDLKTNAGALSATRANKESIPDLPVVLKAGESTSFGVWYPFNKTGGSGVRVTGLVVTPPNETKPVTLAWPGEASLPVTEDGGGAGVEVGPLGSEGQGG
ncbi:DUF4232 domain-containing protein [Streptomyces sp. CA-253872]|uniref:DUF4232 domain-containing protein n=1 Tax=Streptomyces sp. CA-253872 TaxID=3240067 RepID=UPI003D94506C